MDNLFPTIQLKKDSDINSFIEFWSKFYYPSKIIYNDTIVKEQYEIDDIQNLFVWKNGMNLSEIKQDSLKTKISSKLIIINRHKKNKNWFIEDFHREFVDLSAVWKIFLLHIIKPDIYPIYDQHVHRAYNFIHKLPYSKISANMSNKNKEHFYFNTYLKFVNELNNVNLKKFDEAFFAFGKFINTNNNIILFQL